MREVIKILKKISDMKKYYMKPETRVVKLKERPRLLQGSSEEEKKQPKGYRGDFGYVPGLTDDINLQA